jgi:hypothetical protein
MTHDLIERLRGYGDGNNDLMDDAADRIEKLEAALSHYACGCKEDKCTPEKPRYRDLKCGWPARQALGEKKNDAATGPANTSHNAGWEGDGDWVD